MTEELEGTTRQDRRESRGRDTRRRLLDAAVASLIENGVARTTTLEVQRRAASSRGALLHHFRNHAVLLSATVEELVRRNETGVQQIQAGFQEIADPVERAVRTMAAIVTQPSYMAEIELWAVARTDEELRSALVAAERVARKDSERILSQVFAATKNRPGHEAVMVLSLEFLRGLALSGVLRKNAEKRDQLLMQWVWAVRILLDHQPA